MKNTKFLGLALASMMLVSCGGTDTNTFKLLSPAGAPTLALYTWASDKQVETTTTPANVKNALLTTNYDFIVFDSITALQVITANDSATDYRYVLPITGGNFYLAGIDKAVGSVPTIDDNIVSFGQNLVPDLVYRSIYGDDLADATNYVASVAEAKAILSTGLYEGEAVDYVFIAQPALFATLNDKNASTYGKVTVIDNIQDKWETKTGQKGIPQAGLFVRESFYKNNTKLVSTVVNEVRDNIETACDNPSAVKTVMQEFGEVEAQSMRFGFTAAVAYALQKDDQNQFGLVYPGTELDVNTFLTSIGKKTID